MPNWTNVAKPTGANYTNVAKPTDGVLINQGMITGLIMPVTYAIQRIVGSLWTNVAKPFSPELVVNGGFNGDASGWTLGAGWAYSSNNILHSSGTAMAYQPTTTIINNTYTVKATVGGTIGNVQIGFGTANVSVGGNIVAAGFGDFEGEIVSIGAGDFIFLPDSNFNGTITSISIRATPWGRESKPS